jgi:hypothetical protein
MDFVHDPAREELFNSSYNVKPSVHIKYEMNDDGTFKTFTLNFGHKDKCWILEEVYNGNTNMTDYCTLTGTDEKFKRFVDAELKVVELMKEVE